MGEPVTEEMLRQWARACAEADVLDDRDEVCAEALDFHVPTVVLGLIAEVRRLRISHEAMETVVNSARGVCTAEIARDGSFESIDRPMARLILDVAALDEVLGNG